MAENKRSPTEKLTPTDLTPLTKTNGGDGLDVVVDLITRFGRYVWDILGVTFLALSIMTALALAGLTAGSILTPWATFLWHWLGWGSTFIVLTLLWVGVWLLRHRNVPSPHRLSLYKILAWEGGAFSLLALLSVLGGNILLRAEAGKDGGLVGWGLAYLISQLFPPVVSIILLSVLLLFFLWSAFGLSDLLERRFAQYIAIDEEPLDISRISQQSAMQLPFVPDGLVEDDIDGGQMAPPRVKPKPAI